MMDEVVCSKEWYIAFHVYCAVVYTIVVAGLIVALYVQLRLRRAFHPFFTILFGEMMLLYVLCDIATVASSTLSFSGLVELPLFDWVELMYYQLYYFIMPLQSCCLLERLVATIYFHSYEKNRRWILLILTQPLCFGYLILFNYMESAVSHMLLTMCLVTYYIIQTVGLVTLLIVNRQLTKKLTGTGVALTTRYQLAENIRTIRVFLPMIAFDTLISLLDIVKLYLRFCRDSHKNANESEALCFQLVDSICEVMGSFLEVLEVSLVICRYPKVKEVLPQWNSSVRHRVSPEGPDRILNVFGSDLIFMQRNFNYFDDLNRNWHKWSQRVSSLHAMPT